MLNAKAVINFDGIGDDDNLTVGDRVYTLGAGIPPGVVPVFHENGGDGEGAITLLVDEEAIDPGLGFPRVRTFWGQEQ